MTKMNDAVQRWLRGCDFSPLNIALCVAIGAFTAWMILR